MCLCMCACVYGCIVCMCTCILTIIVCMSVCNEKIFIFLHFHLRSLGMVYTHYNIALLDISYVALMLDDVAMYNHVHTHAIISQ